MIAEASECPGGQGLNETDGGVNINIQYGNSTDEAGEQSNNIFNVLPQSCNKGEF